MHFRKVSYGVSRLRFSIYSSIFNIGIGGGAFVGGMVINDYSISAVGYVGGAIAVVAMLFALKRLLPAFKDRSADVGQQA